MNEYLKFKKLLEYFVTHLVYLQNDENDETTGYDKYIKPFIDVGSFKKTGQGYKDGNIQEQIKEWDTYEKGKICIAIQFHQRSKYKSKRSYLQWDNTWFNIIASWNRNNIGALRLFIDQKGNINNEHIYDSSPKTLETLGLFDDKDDVKEELKNFFESFKKMLIDTKNQQKMKEITKILKHKKQIILQGAPGTGKTYISAEIAMNLMNPEKNYYSRNTLMWDYNKALESKQIAFTTFHQSMDYEEFVEGFKPTNENDNLTYKVKNGIFKEICKRAASFEDAYKHLLTEIKENGKLKLRSTHRSKEKFNFDFYVEIESEEELKVTGNDWLNFLSEKEYLKSLFFGEPNRGFGKYKYFAQIAILVYLKNIPYILIIDEINRGNISKILGELITLLEADKRAGEENKLKVTLPYSNEEFTVPNNLYIIATMNTADRSIGHIDYAVRRRFAFIELKADKEAIENYQFDAEETKNKALGLFGEVKAIFDKENVAPDLNPDDLMVGHSYFMAKNEEELNLKLTYEIKPLLLEYVKDGVLIGEHMEGEINNLAI